MNRVQAIKNIIDVNADSFFVLSNGLTSREACHYLLNDQTFYLLHAMGEALSVGIGLASARPDLKVIVIDGDGNALMGMASWSMMMIPNLSYYILANKIYETTGSQEIPSFPCLPDWCNIIKIDPSKKESQNPPPPIEDNPTLRELPVLAAV